jgi:hypothetical protein
MSIFLAAGFVALLGTVGVLKTWTWYEVFEGFPDPAYHLFRGVFLFLGWVTAAVALWKGTLWARNFCGMMAVIHLVWFWIDRVWLTHPALPFKQHIMEIGLSVLCFSFIIAALWILGRDAGKLVTIEDDIEGEK